MKNINVSIRLTDEEIEKYNNQIKKLKDILQNSSVDEKVAGIIEELEKDFNILLEKSNNSFLLGLESSLRCQDKKVLQGVEI